MIVLDQLTFSKHKRCACIGCFDGIHIGHREIISKAVEYSKDHGCLSMVYTFSPFKDSSLLLSLEDKINGISNLGIDEYYCRQFTQEFANMSPEDFVLHLKDANVTCVVVGQDFTFGKGGRGNTDDLILLCNKHNMEAIVLPLVVRNGQKVSSTVIRDAMSQGDVERVKELMGGIYGK